MIREFLAWWFRGKKVTPRKAYIDHVRIKIMFNPFEDKFMWSRLDPVTRIWHWNRPARNSEVVLWLQETEEIQKDGIAEAQCSIDEYEIATKDMH